MLWEGRRQSDNVDDRRGMSGGQVALGGGLIGVIFLLLNFFLTGDTSMMENLPTQGPGQTTQLSPQDQAAEDRRANFVKVVLADTEDVWNKIFSEHGERYQAPRLVLFRDYTQSACGTASSGTGPFYCPSDNMVYIDLSFADQLERQFGATGEFALAYVLAHEVGHHIQYLMGTTDKMEQLRRQVNQNTYNRYSVALELQADFYAGVWARYNQNMKNVIKPQDLEQAMNAAAAVGDDNIMKRTQGYVVPEGFTHGTSQQRMYWFKKGYETGDISQGNTFNQINNL